MSAWALALLRSCHPEPVLAVTAVSTILAAGAGRGLEGSLVVAAAVLAGQLCVGWTNDYLDAPLDSRAGRTDKPVVAGLVERRAVGSSAIVAGALCIPLSLASGLAAGTVHLVAVAAATLYNWKLKPTPFSILPYVVAFGLMPAFITLGLSPPRLPHLWALGAAALIGAGGHFTQVLPDITRDRAQGLRGLPQRMGERPSAVAAAVLLGAAGAAVTLGPGHPGPVALSGLAAIAAGVVGVLLAALRMRTRIAFRLTLATAAVVVAALLASGASLTQ